MTDQIRAQLVACVTSYQQIIEYFSSHRVKYNYNDENNEDYETITLFINARINIISALVSLNFLLNDSITPLSSLVVNEQHQQQQLDDNEDNEDNMISIIGRICLTKRLIDGIDDLCVITDVTYDNDQQEVSDVTFHWIYPRNIYELRSSGIKLAYGQDKNHDKLRIYTQEMHEERVAALQALRVDDMVMVGVFKFTYSLLLIVVGVYN